MKTRTFEQENDAYEAWLREQCEVVEDDLAYKHKRMRKNAFVFLRATYFRWARRIEDLCPELKKTPRVLCVGDLHIENYGTWRDAEGRLVWGVNDFDEAAEMPYAYDLLRLAVSMRLSPTRAIANRAAAAAILGGYRSGLEQRRPVLLDEQEAWMRPYVACTDADRAKFWNTVDDYPPALKLPADIRKNLKDSLPTGAQAPRFLERPRAGGGSLGRPRYVAVAQWCGGDVLREAKALVPSAWDWAHGHGNLAPRFTRLSRGAYRAPDPYLEVKDKFVVRRMAPDARKVELGDEGAALSGSLLRAMGFDLGALHAADSKQAAARIAADLGKRPQGWLAEAAAVAAKAVERDYVDWCETGKKGKRA